jgi:hypothetical protein
MMNDGMTAWSPDGCRGLEAISLSMAVSPHLFRSRLPRLCSLLYDILYLVSSVDLELPDAPRQVADVTVAALGGKLLQGSVQLEQVVLVQAAGAAGPENVLGKRLRVLGADELLVVRGADVDEGADGAGAVGGVEGLVVDGVAVDLADVEILFDLGDLVGDDAVRDTPDSFWGLAVEVGEFLPVGPLDERGHAAGGFRRAPVVLTGDMRSVGSGSINHVALLPLAVCSAHLACQKRRT